MAASEEGGGGGAECACVVTSVVWRTDGAVLAVGYSTGHLCLFEIEKNEPIHFNQKVRRTMFQLSRCVALRQYPRELTLSYVIRFLLEIRIWCYFPQLNTYIYNFRELEHPKFELAPPSLQGDIFDFFKNIL